MVHGVDTVGNEGALAPVEHVAAEPRVDDLVANVEGSGDVGVEHLEVLAYQLLRRVAQRGALSRPAFVLEVDESGGPDKHAEIAAADIEVGGELRRIGDDAPVVVEIAVVAVGVGGQLGVPILDANRHAVGDRGAQAPLEFPFAELDRLRGRHLQEPAQESSHGDRACGAPRMKPSGRVRFACVPHGASPAIILVADAKTPGDPPSNRAD